LDYIDIRNQLLEDLNYLQASKVSYQAICDFVNSKQNAFTLFKDFFTRFRSKDNFYKGKSKEEKLLQIQTYTNEFRFMNENREQHKENQLIKLVEEATQEEFNAYLKVNKKPPYKTERLKKYFGINHPAGLVIKNNLRHKKQYNWILDVKNHGSDYRILAIELTAKFKEYAIIQTNEYWKLCWLDNNTKTLQFVYDSINKQTYLLAKNKEGNWFIKDNIYISDHDKRRPKFIDNTTLSELIMQDDKVNYKTLKDFIKKNEVGLSISFLKRVTKNKLNKTEGNNLERISTNYLENLRQLNTNNINMDAFLLENEQLKKKLKQAANKYFSKKK